MARRNYCETLGVAKGAGASNRSAASAGQAQAIVGIAMACLISSSAASQTPVGPKEAALLLLRDETALIAALRKADISALLESAAAATADSRSLPPSFALPKESSRFKKDSSDCQDAYGILVTFGSSAAIAMASNGGDNSRKQLNATFRAQLDIPVTNYVDMRTKCVALSEAQNLSFPVQTSVAVFLPAFADREIRIGTRERQVQARLLGRLADAEESLAKFAASGDEAGYRSGFAMVYEFFAGPVVQAPDYRDPAGPGPCADTSFSLLTVYEHVEKWTRLDNRMPLQAWLAVDRPLARALAGYRQAKPLCAKELGADERSGSSANLASLFKAPN